MSKPEGINFSNSDYSCITFFCTFARHHIHMASRIPIKSSNAFTLLNKIIIIRIIIKGFKRRTIVFLDYNSLEIFLHPVLENTLLVGIFIVEHIWQRAHCKAIG